MTKNPQGPSEISLRGFIQLGIALLQAGFDGARSNLEGKLSSFSDAAYVPSVVDEIARLSGIAIAATRAAESVLKVLPA